MANKRAKMVHGKFDAVCSVCGAIKQVNYAQRNRPYCSKECRWKVERGDNHPKSKPKIERECLWCHKIFYVQPYVIACGEGQYCCRKCGNAAIAFRHSGENSIFWKGGQVELICQICGKPYKADPNVAKNGPKACSVECGRVLQGKQISGANHPCWRGGNTSWGYTKEFSVEFKACIRDRDGHTCILCGKWEDGDTFDVHHIDYNKKNSIPENCITLCDSCHTKTTRGDRTYYEKTLSLIACEREAIYEQV